MSNMDNPSWNGRVYDRGECEKLANQELKEFKKKCEKDPSLGVFEHPQPLKKRFK